MLMLVKTELLMSLETMLTIAKMLMRIVRMFLKRMWMKSLEILVLF